jgi:(p)ppGpp synthase/HD superfamily hydrolase
VTPIGNKEVLAYATELHKGQTRVIGIPYITHPVSVAILGRAICNYSSALQVDQVIQTALLHDVIEDCNVNEDDLINNGVDPTVVKACGILDSNKHTEYSKYIRGVVTSYNPLAIAVKYADLFHNMYDQTSKTRKDRYRLAMEFLAFNHYWLHNVEQHLVYPTGTLEQLVKQLMNP